MADRPFRICFVCTGNICRSATAEAICRELFAARTQPEPPDANLRGANLRGADLRGADLRDADLRDAGLRDAGLRDIVVDSAGTGPWHAGDDMDDRARAALIRHGYQPEPHVAKQFSAADFADRDLVVALDSGHLTRLVQLAAMADDPDDARASIVMLRAYDPAAVAANDLDVPDPFYDEDRGFDAALGMIERACSGLVAALPNRTRTERG